MIQDNEDHSLDEIKKVWPGMSDEEARIAEDNVRRYVAVMCRIFDRLVEEGKNPLDY